MDGDTVKGRKRKKKPKKHIIPLMDEALTILRRRPRVDGSEWVFVGRKGALTTLKKPWTAFRKRVGLAKRWSRRAPSFSRLRRSLATEQGDSGASKEVIQKTMAHVEDSAATANYDRSDRQPAVRRAMKKATKSMLKPAKCPQESYWPHQPLA